LRLSPSCAPSDADDSLFASRDCAGKEQTAIDGASQVFAFLTSFCKPLDEA
jgi:hypothetical protein